MKIQITDNNQRTPLRFYSKQENKELKSILRNSTHGSKYRSQLINAFMAKHDREQNSVYQKMHYMVRTGKITTTVKKPVNQVKTNNHVFVNTSSNRELKFPIKSISIENNNIIIKY